MAKEAVFTMKLEAELRDRFMDEAPRLDRPASQVVREMMREFVHKKDEERESDKWFRAEVEEGLRELDDPNTALIPHEDAMASLRASIEEIAAVKRANEG